MFTSIVKLFHKSYQIKINATVKRAKMNRKMAIILVAVFIGPFVSVLGIQLVMASETIYIKADGSVYPATAPILRDGNIYVLTDNVTSDSNGIVIERDNIRLDGAGHMLQGTGAQNYYVGIDLTERNNVTIEKTKIKAFWIGINFYSSSDSIICGNELTNCSWGINLQSSSSNNSISDNNVVSNKYGVMLQDCYANTISGNNITSNYWYGIGSYHNCSYNIISENTISKHNYDGIKLLRGSNHNTISRNILTNNYPNIRLDYSSNYNIIHGNKIKDSNSGISLYHSSTNNNIFENEITNNTDGISLSESSSNSIYHNTFSNPNQVDSYNSINMWDSGYPSGGNYWSDYNSSDYRQGLNQNISGNDGIGDSYYRVNSNPQTPPELVQLDNYPLMGSFSDFNATSEQHVQTICNSSITNFQFNGTAMSFYVSGENNTNGFCRICIPTALMSETYHVFVNGAEVSSYLLACSNSTHSYLYFNYTHPTEEVVIVPEFPSTVLFTVFMTSILVLFMLRNKRRTKRPQQLLRPEL
jgi:parallel beta-helix repeat protein